MKELKHFEKIGKSYQIKPELQKILTEVMEDLEVLRYLKLDVSSPLGKVVFLPQSSRSYRSLLASGDIDLNDGDL